MRTLLLLSLALSVSATCTFASPTSTKRDTPPPAAPAKTSVPTTYSLNAVSPGATGAWSFYTASAGETNVKNYLPITPGIDAANTVRVVAEPNDPWRPVMEWEYGYAAGLITVRPESDRNTSIKKGDLIAVWQVPARERYEVRIDLDNVGNDARGGDGGTLILSRLRAAGNQDTDIIERVAIPASGYESPHVQRTIPVDAEAGDRIVMRLNAGIDGYADLWHMRYVIARANAAPQSGPPPATH